MSKGRKYTLNFPVTDTTILDPKELSRLFDKEKFMKNFLLTVYTIVQHLLDNYDMR